MTTSKPSMFRFSTLNLLALPLAVATASAQSTDGVKLQWKFETGSETKIEMTQKQEMAMEILGQKNQSTSETKSWISWKVDSVKDGVATVKSSIDRMVLNTKTALGNQQLDTDVAEGTPGQDAGMGKMIRPLIGQPSEQKMLPSGAITDVKVPPAMKQIAGMGGSGMIEAISRNATLEFPEDPLKIGDSWSNAFDVPSPIGAMKLVTTYTYRGEDESKGKTLHVFDSDVKMEFVTGDQPSPVSVTVAEQDTQGKLYFDAGVGRLHSSSVTQNVTMKIKAQGQAFDQKIKSETTLAFKD